MLYQTRTTKNRTIQKIHHLILFILLSCCKWKYLFYDAESSNDRKDFSLVVAYVPRTKKPSTNTWCWSSISKARRYQSYKKGSILLSRKPSFRISRYKTISLFSTRPSNSDGTNKQKPPTIQQRINYVLTGQPTPEQPYWIQSDSLLKIILPGSIMNLRPFVQLVMLLLFYMFHTLVLAQHSIPFPFQLIPNERGNFQSIGLDS